MSTPYLDIPCGGPAGDPLVAAVPEYAQDPGVAERTVGRAHLYIAQLTAEMARRAVEANALHDDNVRLRAEVAVLTDAIDAARAYYGADCEEEGR